MALTAHYGDGQSAAIHSDSYASHRAPTHKWYGVKNIRVPAGVWVPPITCAYQFRLTGYPRVTNGYSYLYNHNTDTRHVTLIKPGAIPLIPVTPIGMFSDELPFGLAANDLVIEEGEEPKKLGDKTDV